MAGLGGLFSSAGGAAEQLFVWGVLEGIITALLSPALQEISQEALSTLPNTPLDASTAAALVAQAIMAKGDGESEAKLTGIDGSRFDALVTSAGNSLDLGSVVAAYQRGLIGDGSYDPTDVSLQGAMASGAIRETWGPILKKLTISIPSVAEVMNAWLEGQIEEDEANTRYLAAGGDPTWFQTAYNANGQAPTPVELLELLNRGIIPEGGEGPTVVSYDQGFLEGPWRNKWMTPLLALRDYLPPPRTVTAMYHDGQLTSAQASTLLAKQGLTPDLVAAYLTPATKTATTTAKTVSESNVIALYADGLIDKSKAVSMLVALKYPQADAELLIELQDFKVQSAQLSAGVDHVRTLYQGAKITRADAISELEALDISGTQAAALVDTWNVTVTQTVKLLSAAQVVDGWYYNLIAADEALSRLETLGYDDVDAYLLLAIKNKGPLLGVPAPPGTDIPTPAPTPAPPAT